MPQKASVQIYLSWTLGCGCRFLSFPLLTSPEGLETPSTAVDMMPFSYVVRFLFELLSVLEEEWALAECSKGSYKLLSLQLYTWPLTWTPQCSVVLWPGVGLGFVIFTKVVLEMGSESFGSWLFHGELCGHHSEYDSMALLCSLWVDFSRILHSTLLNHLPQRSQDVPDL